MVEGVEPMQSKIFFAKIFFALFVTASLFASEAKAEDAQTNADLRCLVVGLRLAGSPTEALKNAGTIATLYYLGRLDGHSEKLDLENLVANEIAKMSTQDFQSEAKRCGQLLTARGQALQALGKDLISRSQH